MGSIYGTDRVQFCSIAVNWFGDFGHLYTRSTLLTQCVLAHLQYCVLAYFPKHYLCHRRDCTNPTFLSSIVRGDGASEVSAGHDEAIRATGLSPGEISPSIGTTICQGDCATPERKIPSDAGSQSWSMCRPRWAVATFISSPEVKPVLHQSCTTQSEQSALKFHRL